VDGDVEGARAGGTVGEQNGTIGKLLAERIVDTDGARRLLRECLDDLLAGVDAAGTAEFAKVFSEKT
jgi:hypothetical protein